MWFEEYLAIKVGCLSMNGLQADCHSRNILNGLQADCSFRNVQL